MSAIEQFNSRGGSAGSGNWNRTRRFHVHIDSSVPVEHQDPFADEALPPRTSGFATFPGVVVTGYTLVERLSIYDWLVDVNYGVPPLLTPSYGGMWKISVSGSLETKKQDIATRSAQQIEDKVEPLIVGQPDYVEVKPTEGGGSREDETIYTAKSKVYNSVTGKVELVTKTLRRIDLRKREGMQVDAPVAVLTLQNRFYHPVNYGQALAKVKMVNDSPFFGADPGQLRFLMPSITSFFLSPAEYVYEVGFDVILNFQWRTDGHQHPIVHQFEDPDNPTLVSPVLEEGKIVVEVFPRYLETSFDAILAGFTQIP